MRVTLKSCVFLVVFVILFNACTMQKEKAGLLVHNARIYTVDSLFSIVDAMAVSQGKILAAGDYEKLKKKYDFKQEYDAGGKYIFPGFYDAHCHFYGYGIDKLQRVDLTGTASYDEVLERVKAHAENRQGEWILGRGWDQNDWEIKSFPCNEELDELFPGQPVFLTRIDGHAALANTAALKKAGISDTTAVPGGEIVKRNGKLTGILLDNAMDLVYAVLPPATEDESVQALIQAQKDCFAFGITSVADAGLDYNTVKTIDSLQQSGKLKINVYAMLNPTEENIRNFVKKGVYVSPKLTVRSIKLYADGALGSRGAKLIRPYSDRPGHNGLLLHGEDYFKKYCQLAYDNGYQVNTHCIGDSANRLLLNIYSKFLPPGNDKRWRIEHAQVIDKDDFELFGQYSVIPSVQPTHATSDMYWAEERLGKERMKNAYAYKKLLKTNGYLPLGTDFPVEGLNPVRTFFAAVFRKDEKLFPETGFQPENALTREEALRGMTIWAAKAAFEEDWKGSLEPGKTADFVILDIDLMNAPPEKVLSAKILATFVGGEQVFPDSR